MTARILPPEEWPKLAGTEAHLLWPQLDPARTTIVVVEREGAIVGCHVLSWLLHAECLWIAPAFRGKASVARRLWEAVQKTAKEHWRTHALITGATDELVRKLLDHVQAERLPGDHYVIPLTEEARCRPS